MGEIFSRERPRLTLGFTGERLTTSIGGQIEIEHYHRYFLARELCRDKDVLDIASGEGYGSAFLAQAARSVVGVELNAEVAAHAARAYSRRNLHFVGGDVRSIPLRDASVDIVVSFETIEHVYQHDAFIAEVRRVLRPNGALLISTPDRDIYSPSNSPANPFHVHELTKEEFTTTLRRTFQHVECLLQRPMIGSAMLPDQPSPGVRAPITFERRGEDHFEISQGLARAVYAVALASDQAIGLPPATLYIASSDLGAHEAELHAAREQARQGRLQCEQFERQLTDLRTEYQRQVTGNELLRAENAGLERQLADLRAEYQRQELASTESLQSERAAFQHQLADLRTEHHHREVASIESLQSERAAFQRQLADLRSANQTLVASAEALRSENTALMIRTQRFQSAHQVLLEEIHRLWNSSSWRLLRPLRNLVRRSRGYDKETEPIPTSEADAFPTVIAIRQSVSWEVTAPLRLIHRMLPRRSRRVTIGEPPQLVNDPKSQDISIPPLPMIWQRYLPKNTAGRDSMVNGAHLDERWYDPVAPEVSIVILNFNKAVLTQCCLRSLWEHTSGYRYEIIVVDNGSNASEAARVADFPGKFRLLRLNENRFFGEANNIGAEEALGKYLVLMNNDVVVTEKWLEPLIATFHDHENVGGVGPKFLYADGRLQEAGALVEPDGSVTRLGEFGPADDPAFCRPREVAYCSAATFVMRAEAFAQVLGFDLAFDPAYYEDVDLCLKLSQLGKRIYYCPDSTVYHLQSQTTGDPRSGQKLENIVEINRRKFVARWGSFLCGDKTAEPELFSKTKERPSTPAASASRASKAVLFTPYHLIPGGGERYLLTIAQILSQRFEVTLLTPERYSRIRLLTMGRELGIDLSAAKLAIWRDVGGMGPLDLAVVITNTLIPSIAAPARYNLLVCQFPFPESEQNRAANLGNWDGYQSIAVYSAFVRDCVEQSMTAARLTSRPVRILPPPFRPAEDPSQEGWTVPQKDKVILSVGRIFAGGHSKRQDFLIDAFRRILPSAPGYELHFVGSLHPEPEHRDYYLRLRELAKDLPVFFHLNSSPEELRALYRRALVYWHATGIEVDLARSPELCEHFGITILEAMSAGAIPVVVNNGGPAETVVDGDTGFHFNDTSTLCDTTLRIIRAREEPWIEAMQRRAATASLNYAEEPFGKRLWQILAESGAV
ncbi:MAG: methyltransferase domain-containing protein [Candidatus Binataceae bacterium]